MKFNDYLKLLLFSSFLIFISTSARTQKNLSLGRELDSLKKVLKQSKSELSNEKQSILESKIYFIEGELERSKKLSSEQTKLLHTEMPLSFVDSMKKSRGGLFIPFEEYSSYLKNLEQLDCCSEIEEWKYENYSLSYEDFLKIKKVNESIDFSAINYPLLHAAIFYETNQERIKAGVSVLRFHQSLEAAAYGHALDMRTYNFFSHTSVVSGKERLGDRARLAGFNWTRIGENIAISFGINYEAGTPVYNPNQNGGYFSYEYKGDPILPHTYLTFAKAIVNQWMNSPGHKANMLNANYSYLGIGAAHYKNSSFYMMDNFYGVQVFGK
jgi:uncharacterized protein YkwD